MTDTDKFLEIMDRLPSFTRDFFVGRGDDYMPSTKLGYARDLETFFTFLVTTYPKLFPYDNIAQIALSDLDKLKPTDISDFLFYIGQYESASSGVVSNSAPGKKRKLSTIRAFYKYFCSVGLLQNNVPAVLSTPKIREKEILVLSASDQDEMLNEAFSGQRKTPISLKRHEKTKYRDLAILATFLGTGLRVSELVGLDRVDIDFERNRMLVSRKGGKSQLLIFSDRVKTPLQEYIEMERADLMKVGDADAPGPLFISSRGSRITARRVEQIVKQYAGYVLPENLKVTPHTLRKTFGTELYQAYRDIYLVQNVLGHSSPATTTKYYTKFDPESLERLKDF